MIDFVTLPSLSDKANHIHTCENMLSLSTIVLNSRDWSEIIWLPEILRFKINLAISFIRKKPTRMHWLGYNDAVSSLNGFYSKASKSYSGLNI